MIFFLCISTRLSQGTLHPSFCDNYIFLKKFYMWPSCIKNLYFFWWIKKNRNHVAWLAELLRRKLFESKQGNTQTNQTVLVDFKTKYLKLWSWFFACNKLWFSNLYIFETQWCKPLIFQTDIIWSNRTDSLKYQSSTTLKSKDRGIRKSEFVAKTQFLYGISRWKIP